MVPVVEVLGRQTLNPLPPTYIEGITEAVSALIDGLQLALVESTAACVALLTIQNSYLTLES